VLVQVKTFRDFMEVRRIRNECRTKMTNDQSHISIWRQFRFYYSYKFNRYITVYMWRGGLWNVCIGYGVIHRIGGKAWLTGGIGKGFRGLGFGEAVFKALISSLYEDAWLDVLSDNIEALSLYRKLDFVETDRRQTKYGEAIVMCRKYEFNL